MALREAAESEGRSKLHLVVLGHVDAGKSTLMGRLLHDLGYLDKKQVHKNEKEAAQMGKVCIRCLVFQLKCSTTLLQSVLLQ